MRKGAFLEKGSRKKTQICNDIFCPRGVGQNVVHCIYCAMPYVWMDGDEVGEMIMKDPNIKSLSNSAKLTC